MPMTGRMMACGTSSSAAKVNSVANQSPTRLEIRLMVCFIQVPFSVWRFYGRLAIQPIRMAAHEEDHGCDVHHLAASVATYRTG